MTMLFATVLVASVSWTAKWIGAPEDVTDQAFERQFEVTRPVNSAVLHVTGLGFYEAYLNGRKIGDKVLDPSPTDYTRRVFYSTYPIDGLCKGTNTLRILLGHGWYDMRTHTAWGFDAAPWRSRPKALAQLEIDFEDGSHQVVLTDSSWDVVESPIAYDCIREGEVLDGRKTFGRRLDIKAVETEPPKGALESGNRYPAAKKVKSVRPELMTELGNGRWLLSFPITTSGWLRLVLRGLRAGDVVSIRYDENLGDRGGPALPSEGDWNAAKQRVGSRAIDCFFLKSGDETLPKRQANMQVDRFISGGAAEEVFEPHFVYHGFRHVLIEGMRGQLSADDVQAMTVQTDFAQTGSFACSDTVLTELVRMAWNSYRANFTDGIPTDCPHREKLGWTGDAWIASETGLTYFDAAVSYRKWYQDVLDTQRDDGSICAIAPTSGWGYERYTGPVFDAVIGMLPWNLWQFRGDRAIVDVAYPALVKYLAYEKSLEKSPGLVENGLGDWNALIMSHMPDKEYVISCLYLRLKEIAAEFADLKGLVDDGRVFRDSAEETRRALRSKYGRGNGVYANGGQTAQALAIEMGLCTADERPAAVRQLVASVECTGCHVDFGLVGSKFVYRALSDVGRADLAYRMIVNPTEPSMTKWIGKNGTLWEDWGQGFSKCHVMLSDFASWAQQHVAGIRRPLEPGYRRVLIEPVPVAGLSWARGRVETPRGLIASAWTLAKGRFELKVTVPQGTTATVRLPDGTAKEVGPGEHVLACDFEGK